MSVVTQPVPPVTERSSDVPSGLLWRLSVDQYHQMIRAGILTEDDRVELLEGLLVTKMPKNEPHILALKLAYRVLDRALPDGWHVANQDPVVIPPHNEPEPDLSVVRGSPHDYGDHKPGPRDVTLVVEVADTSLAYDREIKKPIYARAGIPYYWIVNLPDNRLEVSSDPTGPAEEPNYRRRQDFGPADAVSLVIEGHEVGRIDVRELLP